VEDTSLASRGLAIRTYFFSDFVRRDDPCVFLLSLTQLSIATAAAARPVHKTTIDAIDELGEKIWDLEGDLLEALSLF
jgi:hypothetical protein